MYSRLEWGNLQVFRDFSGGGGGGGVSEDGRAGGRGAGGLISVSTVRYRSKPFRNYVLCAHTKDCLAYDTCIEPFLLSRVKGWLTLSKARFSSVPDGIYALAKSLYAPKPGLSDVSPMSPLKKNPAKMNMLTDEGVVENHRSLLLCTLCPWSLLELRRCFSVQTPRFTK